ncbi:MAG: glycosyltransferase family 4 protein, partial [Candidatus Eremiobacteraeota bacterium]|nr:glycosyltransferase family 4 protein [Candidatus Eremiobacteraeota bacterium]
RLTRQLSVGMQTYARELTARLPRVAPEYEYVAFSSGRNFGWSEQVALPWAMGRGGLQLAHFLSLYAPVVIPTRYVVTIHDLIHLRFPGYFKAKVRPYYRIVVRRLCTRAERVITDDPKTIEDLVTFLEVDETKVRVIPLGVEERFFQPPAPHVATRPYLLYAGNHRPHKDLPTLFAAWSDLPESLDVDLYVTGRDDFGGELQRRSTQRRRIVALGDVRAEDLAAYYAGARAFVTPALREGFGLPMLEAMAAGCAVIGCDGAVPAALAGAALTFRAGDSAGLRSQLVAMLTDEAKRRAAIERGRRVARELTWDRCARATADVYREVLQWP